MSESDFDAYPERFPTVDRLRGHVTAQDLQQQEKRAPGRKNTRSWCKGRVGRHHTLVIEIPQNAYSKMPCGWTIRHWIYPEDREPTRWYHCNHVELCSACGKVFRRKWLWAENDLRAEECPNYVMFPESE